MLPANKFLKLGGNHMPEKGSESDSFTRKIKSKLYILPIGIYMINMRNFYLGNIKI